MNYTNIKKIKNFCESLHSNPCWREAVQKIESGENDFSIDDVRFINSQDIDDVLASELSNDYYILGCFNAGAIAEATGWPEILIEAAQKGEAFEEIGKAMGSDDIIRLAEIYSREDGYGHHFNHYDFGQEELLINNDLFYVFDNH